MESPNFGKFGYRLYLPSEEDLAAELRREQASLSLHANLDREIKE